MSAAAPGRDEAERQADEALVGALAPGIAHALNNVLMRLVGNLDLVEDLLGDAAAPAGDAMARLRTVAADGSRLSRRLRSLSDPQRQPAAATTLDERLEGLRPLLLPALGPGLRLDVVAGGDGRAIATATDAFDRVVARLGLAQRVAAPGTLRLVAGWRDLAAGAPGRFGAVPAGSYAALELSLAEPAVLALPDGGGLAALRRDLDATGAHLLYEDGGRRLTVLLADAAQSSRST